MKLVIFFFAVTVFSTTINAQKSPYDYGMDTTLTLPVGINVGEDAPKIMASDITGATINSAELLKKGPIVVVFYRGEWCPVCVRYLAELNDSLSAITDLGASVIVVSPEMVEKAMQTKENTESDFVFVSDRSLEICESFNVLFDVTEKYQTKINDKFDKDIAENNGSDEARLPVPATFVIDTKGKVVYKQFEYNYRNRASATDIYNAVLESVK